MASPCRTLCKRCPFAFQKGIFCTLKGHLLQGKRWHIGKALIIKELYKDYDKHNKSRSNVLFGRLLRCIWTVVCKFFHSSCIRNIVVIYNQSNIF